MEENVKITKIKKSCSVGKKVSAILSIVAIVGCVCAIVASVVIFGMGKEFDAKVQQGIEAGVISTENEFGSVKIIDFNVGEIKKIHTDVPALQKILDEQPYSITYGIYCFLVSWLCAVCIVILKLNKVIKKVAIVLGASTVVLFLTSGLAFGALGALTTWVVCTVMDYGKTLQIQSDETL